MSFTEKNILKSYSELFEGYSAGNKTKLIEILTKLLKEKKDTEKKFYASFGAFGSVKSAKKIVREIRSSRKFRKRDLAL